MNLEIEKAFVESFIRPAKRDRWLELICKPKGRDKLRVSLAHFQDLEPKTIVPVPGDQQSPQPIERMLMGLGALRTCYLISESSDWDAREMDLHQALKLVVGNGYGTLISCRTGLLGYYEGEGPGDRVILKATCKPSSREPQDRRATRQGRD